MNTAEPLVSEPHFCDYDIAAGKMKGCKLADSEMGVGTYHLYRITVFQLDMMPMKELLSCYVL